jgi:hypothetical protein
MLLGSHPAASCSRPVLYRCQPHSLDAPLFSKHSHSLLVNTCSHCRGKGGNMALQEVASAQHSRHVAPPLAMLTVASASSHFTMIHSQAHVLLQGQSLTFPVRVLG